MWRCVPDVTDILHTTILFRQASIRSKRANAYRFHSVNDMNIFTAFEASCMYTQLSYEENYWDSEVEKGEPLMLMLMLVKA